MSMTARALRLALTAAVVGCSRSEPDSSIGQASPPSAPAEANLLYVWGGDPDQQASDFLAVIDADRSSDRYGRVITTVPVGATGTMPHHTEYELPPDDHLFANGWLSGQIFRFDLSDPTAPRLIGVDSTMGGYAFPHSFAVLPGGNRLVTYQASGTAYAPPGGLVELDPDGRLVRAVSAVDPNLSPDLTWPYSLAVVPDADRVVVTSTPMGYPAGSTMPPGSWERERVDATVTRHVQVWSLADLRLRATLELPAGPDGVRHDLPNEPRLLSDGSVYLNSFACGLFHLTNLAGATPELRFVYAFPGGDSEMTMCGVPVIVGHFWVQPVGALPGLIVLDISDPANPVEVSQLALGAEFTMPHWISADRGGNRLVLTGHMKSWLVVAEIDPTTGELTVDRRFGGLAGQTGIRFDGIDATPGGWPRAAVHAALFRHR